MDEHNFDLRPEDFTMSLNSFIVGGFKSGENVNVIIDNIPIFNCKSDNYGNILRSRNCKKLNGKITFVLDNEVYSNDFLYNLQKDSCLNWKIHTGHLIKNISCSSVIVEEIPNYLDGKLWELRMSGVEITL